MNIVEIFNEIRDIPYRIPLTVNEKNYSCSGKCVKLKEKLEKLGYKVTYRVCDFLRSDVDLPMKIINTKHENKSTHVYLEITINNEVIVLDPTRDSQLEKILPVNRWDGISNTYFAVKPIRLYSLEASQKIMQNEDLHEIEKDLKINGEFYEKFNERLEETRQASQLSNTLQI